MRSVSYVLFGLLAIGLLALVEAKPVTASNCGNAAVQVYGYHRPAYVAPVAVPITTYAVAVPVYATYYSGNAASAQEELNKYKFELLSKSNELLEFKLNQLKQKLESGFAQPPGPGGNPQPQPMPPANGGGKVGSIFAQDCASCHDASKVVEAKAKLVLTKDGVDAPLSGDEKIDVMKRVLTDDPAIRMPKGKKLGDERKASIINGILQ